MRFLYLYIGGLFYLCAVVLFVFALNASLETNGVFLTEMFPTWLASALIALALALARSTTRLSDCPRRGRTFTSSAELDVDA
jgi:hypothetical protein